MEVNSMTSVGLCPLAGLRRLFALLTLRSAA